MKARFDQTRRAGRSARRSLPITAYATGSPAAHADEGSHPLPVLRSATPEDYRFAESLYVATMGPLFHELNAWDEEAASKRLQVSFDFSEVWMINVDEQDVGWFQISDESEWLLLHQIHLVKTARSQGIGTYVMRCLMAKAQAEHKRISLAVLPNNRARNLYERLGFAVVGADGVKLSMQWPEPGRSEQSAGNDVGSGVAGDSGCRPSNQERREEEAGQDRANDGD